MVERQHLVLGVDALDGHHGHEDMLITDPGRVAGEKGFLLEGLIGLDYKIHPVAGDIDPGQFAPAHQLVDLGDHQPLLEGGRLRQGGGILGAVSRVKVAVGVSLQGRDQADVRLEINKEAGVKLHVGMDGADLKLLFFQHFRDPDTLDTGVGEVDLTGDPLLKNIQMLGKGNRGDNHGHAMNLFGTDLRQGPGKETGLFLVVAFQNHPVLRPHGGFQYPGNGIRGDDLAVQPGRRRLQARLLAVSSAVPIHQGASFGLGNREAEDLFIISLKGAGTPRSSCSKLSRGQGGVKYKRSRVSYHYCYTLRRGARAVQPAFYL